MQKKHRLEVLSKMCGVSVSTMHRFLKQPHLLKNDTRAKIQKILSNVSDIPTEKKTSTCKNIALFVHDSQLLLTGDVIMTIQKSISKYNTNLIIIDTHNEMEIYTSLLTHKAILNSLDGALFLSFDTYINFDHIIQKYNLPIICINTRGNKHGYALNNDNYQAGQDATLYLVDKGYKKIGFVGWDLEDSRLYDRYIGWNRVCETHNIEHDHTLGLISPKGGYIACNDLIENFKPDAIFFACDAMALGGISYLNEHAMQIGQEIGILGFDNLLTSSFVGLSTMDQFIQEKISLAIEYIVSHNTNTHVYESKEISFTPKVIERNTTIKDGQL